MKPNYHDESMTHNISDVKEANGKIRSLMNDMQPYTKLALQSSVGNVLDQEDIDYLHKQLAYALSAFWSDISIHEKEQLKVQDISSKVVQDFDLITSRLYVTKEESIKLIPFLEKYTPA